MLNFAGMSKSKAWIKAFRLRTLPLSLSGILLGSFIAAKNGYWSNAIFSLAMITTVLFQILSNLANDLGDSQKGTDNEYRVGPTRSVQSGEISMKEMKIGVSLFAVLSLISSALLIYVGTRWMGTEMIWLYGVLAILCIVAAITYTVGKKAYGYHGFGDLMVFIFFGLVSVLGVYSLYSKNFEWVNILPAISIGLLSTAVLNLNNMRDIQNDRNSGKKTLVVLMGSNYSKMYHSLLITGSFVSSFYFMAEIKTLYVFMGLIPYILLFIHLRKIMAVRDPKEFDPELKKVALLTFAFALLTSIGLNI
jgi:1,4-dihydroxy-2-naphthoate octaprenyltransferase